MYRLAPKRFIAFLLVLLPLSLLLAISLGAVNVPLSVLSNSFFLAEAPSPSHLIMIDIRLPRVLLTAFVGAILALTGAVMQGLFRNPLADPSLIGVTAGAFLGASLVIVLVDFSATEWAGLPLISLGAFTGGIITVVLVYRLAHREASTSVATMLLAGSGATFLSN